MSNAPRIVPRPHHGITPEEALDVRARCWSYIFARYAEKKAAAKAPLFDKEKEDTDEPLRK